MAGMMQAMRQATANGDRNSTWRPPSEQSRVLSPHGIPGSGQCRLLLPGDADRLGAVLSRQQGLPLLSAARGPRFHPAARPHPALVGLHAGRRLQSLLRHAAGALAASLCAAMRGVRCREERPGGRRHSPVHQVAVPSHQPSRSHHLRPDRGDHRSVRDGLLGRRLHRLQSALDPLLGRMAQPQHLECSDGDRAGAGHPHRRPPAIHEGIQAAPRRILEACVLAVGIVAVGCLAFDRSPAGPDTSPALLYAPVPLLIWAALRFGLGGMSASMLVITILAISGTMQGRGPFLTQTPRKTRWPCSCSS